MDKKVEKQSQPEGVLEPEARLEQIEKQDYATLKRQCLARGTLFEDDLFPANNSSFYCKEAKIEFKWLRPAQIKANPQLFSASMTFPARLDITPGEIGYYWLPGVLMAQLGSSRANFEQTIPPGQSFAAAEYAGIFHFRFCYAGKWLSVVIDDRLPTIEGQLVMAHERSGNYFFVSLLEKAYAKLVGTYEACSGSTSSEAFEDFSGGFCETYLLKGRENANMFGVIYKSILHSSLVSAYIEQEDRSPYGKQLENGLCMGHFYLISAVNSIEVENESNQIQLIRLRNTVTNVAEWKGSWGCKSREYAIFSELERERFGLALDCEGEFWMTYDDFRAFFSRVDICNFNRSTTKYRWDVVSHEAAWEVGVSAGGCSTKGPFASNPRFYLSISAKDCDPDEGNLATVLVGLMQKHRPAKKNTGLYDLKIGFQIYPIENVESGAKLTNEFFGKSRPVAGTRCYINYRQIVGRCRLKAGHYVIVPSTFKANQQGAFLLRLFIERIDWSAEADISYSLKPSSEDVKVAVSLFKVPIGQIATVSGLPPTTAISAVTLQALLQRCIADSEHIAFSLDKCQMMVSLYCNDSQDASALEGTLKPEQLPLLCAHLDEYYCIFCKFRRKDDQGLHLSEVQQCFDTLGVYAGNSLIRTIFNRYGMTPKSSEADQSASSTERCLDFANFAVCALKLRATILLWEKKTHQEQTGTVVRGSKRVVAFGLREFVEQMLRM